jgi:uncharacterized protein YegP (UPF0339 family)
MYFTLYRTQAPGGPGMWRWRLVSGNEIVAISPKAYAFRGACRNAINVVMSASPNTPVRDEAAPPVDPGS